MFDWLHHGVEPELPAPDDDELSRCLQCARPGLAGTPCLALDDGWAFRAYRAGDCVWRFPKRWREIRSLPVEARLLPQLAPELPLPISVVELYEDGPNGLPFTAHRFVPGVRAEALASPSPVGAESLGRFLRALHSFPIGRALDCGVSLSDGAATQAERSALYEAVIRRCFPLLSCEARVHIERTFEAYLNEPANFDFRPVLVHNDIDERNVLADPVTGALTGVIDFGDVIVGDPAVDFAGPLVGDLAKGCLNGQMDALQRGYGEPISAFLPRCQFYEFCWPLFHLLHGLHTDDQLFVEDGIRMINASVPRNVRC